MKVIRLANQHKFKKDLKIFTIPSNQQILIFTIIKKTLSLLGLTSKLSSQEVYNKSMSMFQLSDNFNRWSMNSVKRLKLLSMFNIQIRVMKVSLVFCNFLLDKKITLLMYFHCGGIFPC